MARYFFHSHHEFLSEDLIGRELMSPQSARRHAMVDARKAAASEVKTLGTISMSHRIEVRDEAGAIVDLADAVRLRG
jgi:hypothetical protein